MAMVVAAKTFIHNANAGTDGQAADVKAYMDTLTPGGDPKSVQVTTTPLAGDRVLTLVVVQTA